MDKTLIIKIDMFLRPERSEFIHKKLVDQLKTGIVLLDPYMEVINVPKNIEAIQLKDKKGNTYGT